MEGHQSRSLDPERIERHHAARVAATGTLVLRDRDHWMRGRLVELALDGPRIRIAAGWVPAAGASVWLALRLDGQNAWLRAHGRVGPIEIAAGAAELVIELDLVPTDFEDVIQDQLLAALECRRTRHVVIVDCQRHRRAAVAAAFRSLAFHVIEASSPLEAISALDNSALHPWAVAIADTEVAAHAEALRAFFDEVYPTLRQIAIGDRGPERSAEVLTVDAIPDLARQIGGLVDARGRRGEA